MELYTSAAPLFWFSLSFIVIFCSTKGAVELPANVTVPAVFIFGDSIVDTGNNNYYPTTARCNFPPYGRDFKGGEATGRFSNGKVPSDMIVEELGIKELLPPYLDPTLKPQDLLTGVNFACGGAGYDPLTSKLQSAISLAGQLRLFKEYTQKVKNIVGEEETNTILTNSLYGVVASSNDLANTFYNFRFRQVQYNIFAYTDTLVRAASSFLKDLYGAGARRIAVFGAPPLGCVPSSRTIGGKGNRGECIKDYNQGSELFNSKLSAEVDSLNSILPNAKLVYIDIYNALLNLIQNPNENGFKVVDKGCCGTGTIEVAFTCNSLTPLCPDVSSYIFWDTYHPSERTYKIIVSGIVKKYAKNLF